MYRVIYVLWLVVSLSFYPLENAVADSKSPTWISSHLPEEIIMCWHAGRPYAGPELKNGGLSADFVRTVMQEAGFDPKLLFIPWARCKRGVLNGEYDMLFAMWNNVDQHQANFAFTKTTDIERTSFVVLENSPLFSSNLADLENVSIALHIDGGYSRDILTNEKFERIFVPSDEAKLTLLLMQRVNVIIGDLKRFEYYLAKNPSKYRIKLRALQPPIQIQKTSPAIAKNNPYKNEIIRRYNAAYDRLCKTGVLKQIIDRHRFDFEPIDCN